MNAVAAQETFNPYTIGNSLRNLRENRKKTQMEVAGALGICNSHYARLEGGMRGMSLNMLFLLMGYFQTDANTIFCPIFIRIHPSRRWEKSGKEINGDDFVSLRRNETMNNTWPY